MHNGLATTFNTSEMGTHTLAYSPLREPLAEASYESLPWWPILTLKENTGQVLSRHLPKTTAANLTSPAFRTASYTYYPATDIRAGRVQNLTETSTGGVTTYDYNARGQLISQTGTGTYPQTFGYDALGRRTSLTTGVAGIGAGLATTTWSYVGTTGYEEWKQYPAGQGNTAANLKVYFTWNLGNQLTRRTSQRGVLTDYVYDALGRLDRVDYSDTTPDVKFDYFAHSGLVQKRHDGWGTAGVRVTTYTKATDGTVTNESINDAGSVISLTRGLDSWGRQTSLATSWASGTGPAFTTITTGPINYAYTASQELNTIGNGPGTDVATLYRGSTGETRTISMDYYGSYGYNFSQNWNLDTNGRAAGNYGSFYATSAGAPVYSSGVTLANVSQRWNGDRLAARTSSTDRRWEYRYNARGAGTSRH
jgi:YD repeat-containing protein